MNSANVSVLNVCTRLMESQNDQMVDTLLGQVGILKQITVDINRHIKDDNKMLNSMVRTPTLEPTLWIL